MNPLVNEIQSALNEIKTNLASGKNLDENAMQVLFLTSLLEEASNGES